MRFGGRKHSRLWMGIGKMIQLGTPIWILKWQGQASLITETKTDRDQCSPPPPTKSFVIFEVEEWNTLSYSLKYVLPWFLWVNRGNGQIPKTCLWWGLTLTLRWSLLLELLVLIWAITPLNWCLQHDIFNSTYKIPITGKLFFQIEFQCSKLVKRSIILQWQWDFPCGGILESLYPRFWNFFFVGELVDIFKLIKWHQKHSTPQALVTLGDMSMITQS